MVPLRLARGKPHMARCKDENKLNPREIRKNFRS